VLRGARRPRVRAIRTRIADPTGACADHRRVRSTGRCALRHSARRGRRDR
jgi:hypothetical protein